MRSDALPKEASELTWFRAQDIPVTRPLFYYWAIMTLYDYTRIFDKRRQLKQYLEYGKC